MAFIMEVYSICIYIKRRDGQKKGGQVYGNILCCDAGGDNCLVDLFKIEKDDAKSIDSDGILPLTTPHRSITGSYIEVIFNLKDKDHDLEVSNGFMSFKDFYGWNVLDKRKCYLVHGKDGCAMVHFSILNAAVQAVIEITLKGGDEHGQVFGTIFAGNTKFEFKDWYSRRYYRVALFDAPRNKPCNGLALSRNVVSVSRKESLVIEAHLFQTSGSSFTELVHGSATLPAQLSGTSSRHIAGSNGSIEVTVTWFDTPV